LLAKKIYREYQAIPERKEAIKPRPLRRPKRDFSVGLILLIILSQAFLIILTIQQSTVVITKQYNISEMAETKKTLERENLKLLNEVNSLQSLERIENIAEKKLEMNRPDLESSLLVESYNNKTFTENNSI